MQINTSNSKIDFSVKKLLLINVKGKFSNITGTAEFNENDLSNGNISINIPIKDINTGNAKRDEHLQKDDFFNEVKNPVITFKSSQLSKKNGVIWAKGALSIAGNKQTVEIPFQFQNNRATGSFNIDRTNYNLGKLPSLVIAKNIAVSFDITVK